jgi:hypothetical protein
MEEPKLYIVKDDGTAIELDGIRGQKLLKQIAAQKGLWKANQRA